MPALNERKAVLGVTASTRGIGVMISSVMHISVVRLYHSAVALKATYMDRNVIMVPCPDHPPVPLDVSPACA